jgi:multidrug efflux pump subunit AcrA (membrane-fusion protein)
VGEKAQVAIDAVPGVVFNGTVHDLPSSVVTQDGAITDKTAKIAMDWTQPGAALGMLARVEIVVQQKDGVLTVPNEAVKTVGQRRFVEYMDGNVKRSRSVTTGITTDTQTEIVTGLDEGTTILAGT